VSTVCKLLGVARSNICERLRKSGEKAENNPRHGDCELVDEIRAVVAERPFYGYRRVTAVLNRARAEKINRKRVHRIMRANGLTLLRPSRKPTRAHDGKVTTLASNLRWCSDHFDVRCWNGDVVRVVFSLDTHDREIIAWKATTGDMTGELVCDVIAESVEKRFGDVDRLPRPMQWLSDNGPAYTAHETIAFARMLGFEVCTTPAYSPESNGMAEAFVKTFKRDYLYPARLESGKAVLAMLAPFFEDYNELAPHKGLNQMSPREYLRSVSTKR
jgi:transposase InsO family protein